MQYCSSTLFNLLQWIVIGGSFSVVISDLSKLNLNDSRESNDTGPLHHAMSAPLLQPPQVSNNGSNLSDPPNAAGIWGAGPVHPPTAVSNRPLPPVVSGGGFTDMPWGAAPGGGASPGGGGTGSGSNTTYGPIYNPAAPPPSANYSAMPPHYAYNQTGIDNSLRAVSSSGMPYRRLFCAKVAKFRSEKTKGFVCFWLFFA